MPTLHAAWIAVACITILISTYRNGIRERKLSCLPEFLVLAVGIVLKSSPGGGIIPQQPAGFSTVQVSLKVPRMSDAHSVTQLLEQWNHGDREALDKLIPLVYEELRKMARHYMGQQNPGHTLQTTALIHEAYLRMVHRKTLSEPRPFLWRRRASYAAHPG